MESTKESMLASEFSLKGCDIHRTFNKSSKWVRKNALRELHQKLVKGNKLIKDLKDRCRLENKRWECPHCKKDVNRLTAAHVGKRLSKILDDILDTYPDETDIYKLFNILVREHDNTYIVVCCDPCNKMLEDPTSS